MALAEVTTLPLAPDPRPTERFTVIDVRDDRPAVDLTVRTLAELTDLESQLAHRIIEDRATPAEVALLPLVSAELDRRWDQAL